MVLTERVRRQGQPSLFCVCRWDGVGCLFRIYRLRHRFDPVLQIDGELYGEI